MITVCQYPSCMSHTIPGCRGLCQGTHGDDTLQASMMTARGINAIEAAAPDLARAYIAQAAELARLRAKVEAGRDQIEARVEAVVRRNFVSPEDTAVEALCLRYGYGAVMDAASRLWARRDLLGAFYIGGCIGFRTEEEARAALSAYEGGKE